MCLAQGEEASEHRGADIKGGRQPVGGARHQLFDREADRQQRDAGEREDQLGIGAEKIGMGVIVAIARSVLFCAFGMAARPVIVPGMVAGAVIVSRMRAGMFGARALARLDLQLAERSEEHTSELQSLMRISYDVFCLKKKKQQDT